MKKIIMMIILFCSSIMIVSADMGAPGIINYEVKVIKEGGANLTSNGEIITTIPYGEILTISFEYYDEKCDCYSLNTEYNNEFGSILSTEVINIEEPTMPNEKNQLSSSEQIFIVEKGAYLFSGPSNTYKKVTEEISIGTELIYNYNDGEGGWVYTEYNGVKGWLDVIGNNLAETCGYFEHRCAFHNIKTVEELKIYSFPKKDSSILDSTIPSDAELDFIYSYCFYDEEKSERYCWKYVNYEGVKGWINAKLVAYDIKYDRDAINQVISAVDIPLYNNPLTNKKGNTLPTNVIINPSYYYDFWDSNGDYTRFIHFDYEEEYYWADSKYFGVEDQYVGEITTLDECKIYATPSLNSKIISDSKIPSKTSVKYDFYYSGDVEGVGWYYVLYNNVRGWIRYSNESSEPDVDKYYIEAEESVILAEKTKTKKDVMYAYKLVDSLDESKEKEELLDRLSEIKIKKEEDNKTIVSKKENKLRPNELVYVCIGAAIVLALTATVTIVLIKKKKTKKNANLLSNDNINTQNIADKTLSDSNIVKKEDTIVEEQKEDI